MRVKKAPNLCCVCKKAPVYVYGRCAPCFRTIDPRLFRRLKAMTRAERIAEFAKTTGQVEPPKWEFENPDGEAELAERVQQQEHESKVEEIKNGLHPK
jgi:hypothetical protein